MRSENNTNHHHNILIESLATSRRESESSVGGRIVLKPPWISSSAPGRTNVICSFKDSFVDSEGFSNVDERISTSEIIMLIKQKQILPTF